MNGIESLDRCTNYSNLKVKLIAANFDASIKKALYLVSLHENIGANLSKCKLLET